MTIAFAGCLAACLLLLVWAVAGVPYLPTNDGPQWIFSVHVENNYADPASRYADTLIPLPQFASKGFSLLYAPLEAALGWQTGFRVALALIVLAGALAMASLARAVSPERRANALLAVPLALGWPVYMGLFAYSIGTVCGIVIIALTVARMRRGPLDGRTFAWLALGFALESVLHVFSAMLTAGVLLVVLAIGAAPGERRRAVGGILVAAMPVAAVLALSLGDSTRTAQLGLQADVEWIPWSQRLAIIPRFLAPGPFPRAWIATAFLVFALLAPLVGTRSARLDKALALPGLGLLLAVGFAPLHVPGWQFFSPRMAPLAVALAVAVAPTERFGGQRVVLALAAALAVVGTWSSATFHRKLAAGCSDLVAALAAPVKFDDVFLPIGLSLACGVEPDAPRSEVPFLNPLFHFGSLVATARGGISPFLFLGAAGSNGLAARPLVKWPHRVPDARLYASVVATPAFESDRQLRETLMNELASDGMTYDAVAIAGHRAEDLPFWAERGFVLDWVQGSFAFAHFEPCAVEVEVPIDREVRVDVGTSASPETMWSDRFRGRRRMTPAPCGRMWLRFDAGELECAGSDAGKRVWLNLDHSGGSYLCRPRQSLPLRTFGP